MVWKLFITFFKIGAFTFGGGYAMVPIIQEEVVEKHKWIEDDEFMDAIALAQASPGAMAINTSIYCGYRVKGLSGALACTLGTILPSFITILMIAMFFYQFRNNHIIDSVFKGIGPAVVALIASAVYKMFIKANFGLYKVLIGLIALMVVVFLDVSPIWLILAAAFLSLTINTIKSKRDM